MHEDEPWIQRVFQAAINEYRCGDLFDCLIGGGSATVDAVTGKLNMITPEQLNQIFKDPEYAPGIQRPDSTSHELP